MPKHVETRTCRDCGTEFPLPKVKRYAKRCPICSARRSAGIRRYITGVGRIEVVEWRGQAPSYVRGLYTRVRLKSVGRRGAEGAADAKVRRCEVCGEPFFFGGRGSRRKYCLACSAAVVRIRSRLIAADRLHGIMDDAGRAEWRRGETLRIAKSEALGGRAGNGGER